MGLQLFSGFLVSIFKFSKKKKYYIKSSCEIYLIYHIITFGSYSLIESGITPQEKATILEAHNRLRSAVAMGLQPGQPGAQNMKEIVSLYFILFIFSIFYLFQF